MPDITIDTLSIEIDKKGQPTTDALKNLKDRLGVLDALSQSIASFGEKGLANLTSFATALNTISSALDSIDTKKLQALKNVNVKISQSRNQKKSAKSDDRSNDSIENELQKNTQPQGFTFSGIENTDEEKIRVAKTGTGYSEGKTVSTQTEDLSSATAKAFDGASKVDSVIANIQKKTEMLSSDLNARLARMVDDANKSFLHLGETYGNQPFMAEAIEQSKAQIQELVDNYKDKIAELKDIAPFVSAKADVMGARDNSEAFNEFKDQVDVASNDMKNMASIDMSGISVKIKEITKGVKDLAQELEQANKKKQELTETGSISGLFKGLSGLGARLQGLLQEKGLPTKGDLKRNKNDSLIDWDKALERTASVAKGLGSVLGGVWKQATSGVREFASKMDHLRKRFGQLVLTRALRKIITEFGKAVKEGVDNLYQWSSALGGQFARSMDQASASTLYLKNSFGAMVAPIINALVPALNMVIDAIVGVMNAFNQLFALLGGQTYWTKAIKQQKDYAKATGGSTKANKDYLLSIDELNVLNDDKGGSGGGSAMDYSNMFEDVTVFDDWAKKIQEAIDEGDWYGVGEIIGKKLNEVILDLDTAQWGSNLAVKINHALDASLGLLETINTKLWGGKVSAFFNKIFEDVNFDTAGKVLAEKTNKIWEFFLGIVQTFKWDVAGKAFQDGINGWIGKIDPSTITSTFNALWQGVMKVITDGATADWGTLGTKVGEAINNFDWKGNIGSLTKAVQSIGEGLFELMGSAIKTIDWETLGRELTEGLFGSLNFENLDVKLSKAVLELVRGIGQLVLGILEGLFPKWSGKLQEFSDRFDTGIDNAKASIDEAVALSKARTETALDTVGTHVETTVATMDGEFAKIASMNYVDQWDTNDVEPTLTKVKSDTKVTVEAVDGIVGGLAGMTYVNQWETKDVNPTFEEVVKNAGLTEGDVNKKFSPIDSYTHFATWYENDALFNMGETVRLAGESEDNILNKLSPIASYDMYAQWYKDDVLFNMDLAETLAETGYKNISDSLSPIKDFDMWRQWKQNDFDPVFGDLTYDKMKSKGESIASGISAGIKSIPLPTLDISTATKGVMVGVKQQLLSIPSFTWRAGGGFPDQGEMFIARENGAEMVGRIGNKTAVANNDQIVDAIAYGVYQAVTEAGGMGGGAQTINVVAELDGQKMYESNKTVGRDRGYDLGMGAFGYVNNI